MKVEELYSMAVIHFSNTVVYLKSALEWKNYGSEVNVNTNVKQAAKINCFIPTHYLEEKIK